MPMLGRLCIVRLFVVRHSHFLRSSLKPLGADQVEILCGSSLDSGFVWSNDDPGMTSSYFMARSMLET